MPPAPWLFAGWIAARAVEQYQGGLQREHGHVQLIAGGTQIG
jgi:hypothetical protein